MKKLLMMKELIILKTQIFQNYVKYAVFSILIVKTLTTKII